MKNFPIIPLFWAVATLRTCANWGLCSVRGEGGGGPVEFFSKDLPVLVFFLQDVRDKGRVWIMLRVFTRISFFGPYLPKEFFN